ncbi:tripartite motif-containing protein 16-like isoform X1 [Anarrhichthys ocellatus]|uniref:tripartite motif-containing protein 16-like isoform X1 n=1 Tax=Anarrhichthys ocellatus TaxID=433405 RepID=UPI0012ED2DEF|nr:tripartite motif-containing protein 16-like isoform X1 [Anarrhichthys ocellatus]
MAEPRITLKTSRLCCPVCGELLRNPATISCGHSFCTRCIHNRLDRDERKYRACSCPECGHKFPSRPEPIKNTALADLVRDMERRGAKRKDSGPSMQTPKRAGLRCMETGTSSGSNLCVSHSRPLDIYCCTDEQIICALCASAEHTGHTIGSVGEERRRKQTELRDIQTKSKRILQEQEKKCKNMVKNLKLIQEEEGRETQDYCETVLAGIIDSLQRHYMSVRELIRGHEKEAAAQVQSSLQTLQVKMEEMKKRDAELDRLAQTDSDVHFLQGWSSMQRLCKKDHLHHLHEDSEDPLLPFEFTKRAVNQLGKQLEEFCDRKFASLSQTADGGEQQESEEESEEDDMQQRCEASNTQSHGLSGVNMTEHNVEPKTRAEFLQYACCLSLDPTTAHEDLVISAGDKEVRLNPSEFKSQAVRYPQRFIHRRQVLCREGLQAERCYYEIEVEGDKAEIALAYKGIDRKSFTQRSAFGANANSWSLDRAANYSVSHRADSIQLKTCPSQRRLGVYLNFKEGALSFYEVSDRMMFLYKVDAEFTEPLYPGFWLGQKCCISICDLTPDGL